MGEYERRKTRQRSACSNTYPRDVRAGVVSHDFGETLGKETRTHPVLVRREVDAREIRKILFKGVAQVDVRPSAACHHQGKNSECNKFHGDHESQSGVQCVKGSSHSSARLQV